ncbi:MAG: histidine kinase [Gammaproteobacteria bacterium (ex Lamellibrachia satsuma)]|nr:MAG: PAS domain S-box protein [Gammaproteobacteria bacterium (ex Lamellibrachia satsuma)]RRS34579.1 MAG: histidine kinase [Gammaproteobacteria bacterium (ex Lamellibrachia satsuma)]RRS37430.1 MAG: histidine kinase [Gammaproteobacteria bacterium (ex Lamellibrachia satsuma)]
MPLSPPPSPLTRLSLVKGFLQIFVPLLLVLVVVGFMHYYTLYTTERVSRESSETLNVGLARRMIASDISAVVSDLLFLVEHIERQKIFQMDLSTMREQIGLEFLVFAEKKRLYDQIRFLDEQGMEVVRINFNDGNPAAIPIAELQNKATRYYFQEASQLASGSIYVSPLDLNIEAGKIEYPLKPVMRFAAPVFDIQGNKRGILLLNFLGDRLIDNFTHAAANIGEHIELVNNEGYWLSSPVSQDNWGFMLGNDATFGKRHPVAWKQISAFNSGQFELGDGLFTFATVHPNQAALETSATSIGSVRQSELRRDNYWKIISRVPPSEIYSSMPLFLRTHLALYLATFMLIGIGSAFLAYSHLRHRRAEAQSEYEQRFRHTLENIELAAVALDRSGNIRFCNNHFLSLTGWQRHEVVGENWVEKFAPQENDQNVRQVLERMANPEDFPTHLETQVKTKSGSLRLITWNNTLSYDAEGEVIGVTGIGEDITEKRHAENELRKLFMAVEQSPSIVLITDRQGKIEYVNPKFSEVTGYLQDEVFGEYPSLLKSGETSNSEYETLWQAISHGGEWRGEFHNRRKNGELYWETAVISAIRDTNGEITNYLAVKEDITERKRLEQEVETRNRELASSQTLAAMGRMASMIAHDLRNPLSSIKMTLQILGKQPDVADDNKVNELRQISLSQVRYMEEILSDMLTYSRPDAINPEWISLEKVIDTAVGLAQRKIEEHGVNLQTFYQPGLPTIFGDANKLRQVFSNLIVNAAQATDGVEDPKTSIEAMVELGAKGTGLRIEICDNGCGIDSIDRTKVFEAFYTTRAQGTGLGLAIVKRIVDQHHGTIELHPNEPNGTCLSIIIPTTPQSPEMVGNRPVEVTTS